MREKGFLVLLLVLMALVAFSGVLVERELAVSGGAIAVCSLQVTTPQSLPAARLGVYYSKSLDYVGRNCETATWHLYDGALPEGLSLSTAGVISGVALVPGEYEFSIRLSAGNRQTVKRFLLVVGDQASLQVQLGSPRYEKLAGLTSQALKSIIKLEDSDILVRSSAESAVKISLQQRKQLMLEAFENDPETALRLVLPAQARERFPDNVRDLIEKEEIVDGWLAEAWQEGYESEGRLDFYLDSVDGKMRKLHFSKPDLQRLSGSKVRSKLYTYESDAATASLVESVTVIESSGQLDGASVQSSKKILVLACNFQNNVVEPRSLDLLRSIVFTSPNSADEWFKEASYGKWELVGKNNADGDVSGYFTMPIDYTGTCDWNGWSKQCKYAAQAAGVDWSGYDNVISVIPGTSCGESIAMALEGWSDNSINGVVAFTNYLTGDGGGSHVITHELGHTLMYNRHANNYGCSVAKSDNPSTCASSEYADRYYDNMGLCCSKPPRHTNVANKGKFWFVPSNTVTVSGPGMFFIEPASYESLATKAVRIPRIYTYKNSQGSTVSVNGYYYLEYRRPYGTFETFSASDAAVNGVTVRLAADYSVREWTHKISVLGVGQSLNDAEAGIIITVLNVTSSGALIDVRFPPKPCVRANPTITVSPSSQTASPGQGKTYKITVRNNDNDGCDASNFNVIGALPAGLSQSPATLSFGLVSGASATGSITVTSQATQPEGTYAFTQTASNLAASTYRASTSANYNIVPVDDRGPSIVVTSPSNGSSVSGSKLAVAVSASDPSGVAQIRIWLDSALIKTCTGSTSCTINYNSRALSIGMHTIIAEAVDSSPLNNKASVKSMFNFTTSTKTTGRK